MRSRFIGTGYKPDASDGIAATPSLTLRARREPQVWLAQSQTVRSIPHRIDLILPVRGRARPEILARTFLAERYAASVVRQRAATEGPGKDSSGGVAFRPRTVCQAP